MDKKILIRKIAFKHVQLSFILFGAIVANMKQLIRRIKMQEF